MPLDVRVAGTLDAQRLRRALDAVSGVPGAGARWLTTADCDDDEALDRARVGLHRAGVPLTSPPFGALLARHPAGDVLMLDLNHAAVGAFGAVQVLDACARVYARDGGGRRPLDFLACADLPVRATAAGGSRVARLRRRAVERLRDALSRPRQLAADGQAGGCRGYGFHQVAVSGVPEAPGREALLAALHLAIAAWNEERGGAGGRIGVRLLALWAKQSSVVLQPITASRRADAATFCDLGDVSPSFGADAGAVREVWFSPPSRSERCLCLGAVRVAGRLHLTFRHPHGLLGRDAVRAFADCHLAQLERCCAAPGGDLLT